MFGFLKNKKTPISVFFERLTEIEKKAIIGTLFILSACDGDSDEQGTELMLIRYYCRHLDVKEGDVSQLLKLKGVFDVVQLLANLKEVEKAALFFILRGMANIDQPANSHEIALLKDISRQLDFDLDDYFSKIQRTGDDRSHAKIMGLFKDIIFPNGSSDVDSGAKVINHFASIKLDTEFAKRIYVQLATSVELAEVRSLEVLIDDIEKLGVEIKGENAETLFKFFRGTILGRISKT